MVVIINDMAIISIVCNLVIIADTVLLSVMGCWVCVVVIALCLVWGDCGGLRVVEGDFGIVIVISIIIIAVAVIIIAIMDVVLIVGFIDSVVVGKLKLAAQLLVISWAMVSRRLTRLAVGGHFSW